MKTKELGSLIRHRRKELNIDQKSLAELAGVSVHTLSDIESGKANPSLDIVDRVLHVLGLQLKVELRRSP
ncbi:helix-turn-helix transcriptional regulator [Lujinxingia vulgaris]|uniref:Helix-turn-helix transcriptional regulator n=1 Tax=Lujinxingia vulgaris TaxID=2600176 RepID=A0A5C6X7A6_9DELT|nr:helix-turn-helix transcriptional regulator [Lujinxingia vulgaris]